MSTDQTTPTLEDALGEYWDAAYAEGREGRTHDTADGRAAASLWAIHAAIEHMHTSLQAELAAAKRDAARLDWLDSQWRDGVHLEVCAKNTGLTWHGLYPSATVFIGDKEFHDLHVRSAIDAAREAIKQENT